MTLVGVFTDCSERGGVGQYSRQVAGAFHEIAGSTGTSLLLLGLNDPAETTIPSWTGPPLRIRGFSRNKRDLASYLLRHGGEIDRLFLGHPNLAPLGPLLRLRNPRLRYWVAAHGSEVWESLSFHRRWSLRTATGLAPVSSHTARSLIERQGAREDRITIIPNALDPAFADMPALPPDSPLPRGARILLSVGRLHRNEPGKGIDHVLRALPAVLATVPDAYYVVVGEGDLRPELECLALDLDVAHRVRFTGPLGDEMLRGYLAAADVLVLPSRQEGFGIVFLEAMAFRKPVIGGAEGGTPDVIAHGTNGFLVGYGDVAAVSNHVTTLLTDDALRRRMGHAGRALLCERFTFDHLRRRLEGLLGFRQRDALEPHATATVSAP